ncbi:coenzyme Q-binding protein COQ10 [Palleronia marisminoris]|uniref:Persistence and stress-resistance toxin PasT n=1 Tax=Palleronia marisminoris TaxID=315423 RepID=A0A1Y5TAL9_9RHOB|nr:type II toxin-antitoxin system RatA family toxin [Palleronia marisminoris]SFH35518.1 coenzyme Q-binding protein COQ10 [Palleronia marisminoris]SLN59202.1 Persistence and stress-resistance toxin PasT [Palleronia marisminoris]
MPKHHETRKLPYTAQQMYDLVGDVESYPNFIPWISAARITSQRETDTGEVLEADLVISFKVFRERFRSRVTRDREEMRIDTEYLNGPFRHMNSTWAFRDVEGGGCEVLFDVDFEFKSRILGSAAQMFFNDAMQRIVRAFEREASKRYG